MGEYRIIFISIGLWILFGAFHFAQQWILGTLKANSIWYYVFKQGKKTAKLLGIVATVFAGIQLCAPNNLNEDDLHAILWIEGKIKALKDWLSDLKLGAIGMFVFFLTLFLIDLFATPQESTREKEKNVVVEKILSWLTKYVGKYQKYAGKVITILATISFFTLTGGNSSTGSIVVDTIPKIDSIGTGGFHNPSQGENPGEYNNTHPEETEQIDQHEEDLPLSTPEERQELATEIGKNLLLQAALKADSLEALINKSIELDQQLRPLRAEMGFIDSEEYLTGIDRIDPDLMNAVSERQRQLIAAQSTIKITPKITLEVAKDFLLAPNFFAADPSNTSSTSSSRNLSSKVSRGLVKLIGKNSDELVTKLKGKYSKKVVESLLKIYTSEINKSMTTLLLDEASPEMLKPLLKIFSNSTNDYVSKNYNHLIKQLLSSTNQKSTKLDLRNINLGQDRLFSLLKKNGKLCFNWQFENNKRLAANYISIARTGDVLPSLDAITLLNKAERSAQAFENSLRQVESSFPDGFLSQDERTLIDDFLSRAGQLSRSQDIIKEDLGRYAFRQYIEILNEAPKTGGLHAEVPNLHVKSINFGRLMRAMIKIF